MRSPGGSPDLGHQARFRREGHGRRPPATWWHPRSLRQPSAGSTSVFLRGAAVASVSDSRDRFRVLFDDVRAAGCFEYSPWRSVASLVLHLALAGVTFIASSRVPFALAV